MESLKSNRKEPIQQTPTSAPCPLYRKCGGCQLQNMDYLRQLHWKQKRAEHFLGRFCSVNPILGMENPYHYRNKVQAAFAMDKRHQKIISGVYQSSTHKIVPVDDCLIEDEKADQIIVTIRKLMKSFRMEPYDEITGRGFLRHVLIKRGFHSGQIMVVLVAASPIIPAKNNFIRALLKEYPEITTIILNLNDRYTSMVLGEKEKILYGPGYIADTLCGCIFRISAKSFSPINPIQTEVLYNQAIRLANLSGKETIIDAYCGIGTIGIVAARHVEKVIGVEVNRDAVHDAIVNAKYNKIQNTYFYHADAGEFMSEMAEEKQHVDIVFMDPPRAGSDFRFLSSMIKLCPKKIVYISCNLETQARDLIQLVQAGYQVKALQPVDMFPHTNHVENIALLLR